MASLQWIRLIHGTSERGIEALETTVSYVSTVCMFCLCLYSTLDLLHDLGFLYIIAEARVPLDHQW